MAERLRVAYVADTTVDPRMIDGLAARMDLTLLVPRGIEVSTFAPDAPVTRVALGRGRFGFLIAAAWWLVMGRRRYDVIIALDNVRAALAANAGGLLARRPVILQLGRPTVAYYRCRARKGLRYAAGLAALRTVVWVNERLARAVGAISEHVASQVARGVRVERIPWYGVDLDIYGGGVRKREARARLGIDHDGPLLLFRSRMAHEKDPGTFLEALGMLRAGGRDVRALYVGGEYLEFEALGDSAGVPIVGRNHVDPRTELPLFYAAADATVQTSHAEGLGMSVLESLAMGTPVVVTGVGGLIEAAGNGDAGRVVGARDPGALATAIAWVLDHPGDAAEQAERGRRMVHQRYASQATFDAWAALAAGLVRARVRIEEVAA